MQLFIYLETVFLEIWNVNVPVSKDIGYKYNRHRKAQTFFIVHVRNMFSFPNKKKVIYLREVTATY